MLAYNIEITDEQIENTSNHEHQNRRGLNKHAIQLSIDQYHKQCLNYEHPQCSSMANE